MRAIVLVGGEGTRLRPLTYTTPKQLLPVGGRPMIERVLTHLHRHGIDEVVLSLGYKPDAFLAAYPDGRCAGVGLRYAVEATPLDTAGAIAFAAASAGIDGDETVVVVNGDVLTDLDVSRLIEFHQAHGGEATIALTPVEEPSRFGVVPTDADGRVQAFIEKPAPGTAPTNLINAGTYVLSPAALARIPVGERVSIERETFPALVAAGQLYALASDGEWVDAGTPETYLAANLRYAPPDGGPADRTGGPPGTGAGPRIAVDAVVRGSVLGDGVVVESGAVVVGSLLSDGARVGSGAEVRDSVIGPGATVGAGCVIEAATVIGAAFEVPPGTRLAGARVPSAP